MVTKSKKIVALKKEVFLENKTQKLKENEFTFIDCKVFQRIFGLTTGYKPLTDIYSWEIRLNRKIKLCEAKVSKQKTIGKMNI